MRNNLEKQEHKRKQNRRIPNISRIYGGFVHFSLLKTDGRCIKKSCTHHLNARAAP